MLEDDRFCFACGPENLDGLRLTWKRENQTVSAHFVPERKHQGWKGIVHGGILATLLDEAIAQMAWLLHSGALTAEMTIRYIAPARIGETLHIRGELIKDAKKLLEVKASISDSTGTLIAHATGKAIKVS